MTTEPTVRESTCWTVPVSNLERLVNPMQDNVWGCGEIEGWDVIACEDNSIGRLPAGLTTEDSSSWEYNVARIAWLIENGWDDKDEPITVDVYPETIHEWPVLVDGNHRFAAALVMGMEFITVEVSGDIEYLEEALEPVFKR